MGEASLVLVGRVVDVSETRILVGGKAETTLQQFQFAPAQVLKGVFSRESLSLTGQDLGIQNYTDSAPIEHGQLRLLMLGRSPRGYEIFHPSPSLEQAIPPLRDLNDELIETCKVLLAVNATPERPTKVVLLLDGLRAHKGPAAIPLLASLERRSLLAAQTQGVMEAVIPHLGDPSPAVRERSARTLASLLKADYLNQPALREGATKALTASLETKDSNFQSRVAAFEAFGVAGSGVRDNKSVKVLLELHRPTTFAEQGARLHALGDLEVPGNKLRVHGYHTSTLANGDKCYVRFQGTGTSKDGKPETAEGTWSYTGGTGSLKGLKGKGTYKGNANPDGSITYEIEGEYEIQAKAPAKSAKKSM